MSTSRAQAGFTLIELMLVMGLIAIVLGVGLGSLAALNPGERAAVGLVQDALRSAHNSAIARTAPARVRFDAKQGTMISEGLEVMGTWHFEDVMLDGAEGLGGTFFGMDAAVTQDGWLGNALDFSTGLRGGEVAFNIQRDPGFDFSDGFAIDLAIKPKGKVAGRLLEVADVLEVDMTAGGGLRMRIYRHAIESGTGRARHGAGLTLETTDGLLRKDHWLHLRFSYDRHRARILADGIEVASEAADFEVWKVEQPLRLGDRAAHLPMILDELSIAVVVASDLQQLPGDVLFREPLPKVVRFVAGGSLDPTLHFEPVEIFLEMPSGRTETVRVGMYGTVE
ncbi:MAG: prepilin-type N-terminal cleavage/methylation domain-containing protein [Planctomycetota bacterium]|nr:prepilin-type N-terminal cleavage/methylation domain-containing protein [Planctomycetota bacterium]